MSENLRGYLRRASSTCSSISSESLKLGDMRLSAVLVGAMFMGAIMAPLGSAV